MKLQCERVKRHLDEHPCDWCGQPVYVGDRSCHDADSGGLWCSERCATADRADGLGKAGRWAKLVASVTKGAK